MTNRPTTQYYRDRLGNLYIDGYFYMGRPRTPPLPPFIVMEDRTTGTQWVLSDDDNDVLISDQLPGGALAKEIHTYGPYDGPYIRTLRHTLRLFVDNGQLGYDLADNLNVNSSGRIYTREGYDRRFFEIVAIEPFTPGDTLAYVLTEI